MRKLIFLLMLAPLVFLSLKSVAYGDNSSKSDSIIMYGQMFGAAEACGVLQKNSTAIARIVNAVDETFTEKSDRMLAIYAFAQAAVQAHQKVKEGTFNKTCSEVDMMLGQVNKK